MLVSLLRYIYHFIILFCFTMQFPIIGPLTTRRLAFIIAIITLLVKAKKVKALFRCINKNKLYLSLVLLLACAFITFIHHMDIVQSSNCEYIEFWYYIYIIMYVFIFALYCALEFKSFKELAIVWISFMVVESIAIYIAVVNTPVRLLFYELFYLGDDRFERTIENGSRIMGIGISSATGSLTMSTAIIMLTYSRIKEFISINFYLILSVIIISATAFIGRTGVLVEAAVLFFYFIYHGISIKNLLMLSIGASLLIFTVMYILTMSDSGSSDTLLEWMLGAFDEESRAETMQGIEKGGFPPFTTESVFGTGLATGYRCDGQLYSPDSGYIRLWISIGLVGFMAFYYAMYKMFTCPIIKICEKNVRRFIIFTILLAFIVEYKEPFMMKYIYAWAVLTMTLFETKEQFNLIKTK